MEVQTDSTLLGFVRAIREGGSGILAYPVYHLIIHMSQKSIPKKNKNAEPKCRKQGCASSHPIKTADGTLA